MRSQRHINIIRRQFNSTLRVIIHRDYTTGILSPQQLQSFGRCGGNSTVRPPLGYILTAATNKTIRIWSIKYARQSSLFYSHSTPLYSFSQIKFDNNSSRSEAPCLSGWMDGWMDGRSGVNKIIIR